MIMLQFDGTYDDSTAEGAVLSFINAWDKFDCDTMLPIVDEPCDFYRQIKVEKELSQQIIVLHRIIISELLSVI